MEFMDLLFKRYASPFLFLDTLIENGNLCRGIDEIYHQKTEERWWEMYLATLPLNEQSYDDWKKSMTRDLTSCDSEQIIDKKYVETAIEKSQNILSNFIPS